MNSKHPVTSLWPPPSSSSSSSSPTHLLLYVLVIYLTSTIISGGNETDHEALLKIKSLITQDPYGALSSWNRSLHFCDWDHVYCGKRHRRVTSIRLESNGLVGSLSPYVGNLSFLRMLFLANNSFQGAIPYEITGLSRLRFLFLYQNKFDGVIPTNISSCYNLEKLDLSYNKLVGRIPKEISFLSNLTFVALDNNNLTGGIPPFLGNLTSLEELSIKQNPIGGKIPNTLSHLKSLKEIYLGGSNLTETIPSSLYNLSFLTHISLAGNQLYGSLHPAIGGMLPHLVYLQLWGNQLSGPLPSSISNCSRLTHLEMAINKFSGKLTIDFSKLSEIKFISMFDNLLGSKEPDDMKFIDSLKNCTKLLKLELGYCKFQGVLPWSIGNLSNQLNYLRLYGNQLHGNLPRSIGSLVGLEWLSLGGNQFTGNIPSTIGNLKKLGIVELGESKFSGQIPDTIGNLSSLISLSLSSNMLEGVIPSSLGHCQNLLALYLDDNKLYGKIPKELLQLSSLSIILNLSHNHLSGSLPVEVGDLNMLTSIYLSDNNLSGNIPSSLSGCTSLSSLSLKGNLFHGMIPSSLISLKGLVELDISHNKLSGKIPRFFESIKLECLDMSYNNFEGEVPTVGVFANKSAFSILGNNKVCGGLVEFGLPKCKEAKKYIKKFPQFVIFILVAFTLLTSVACLAYVWFKKKRKRHHSQLSKSEEFVKVSYSQLVKATDGFSESNLIGKGGFSSVYKGILDGENDIFVAIKVLHLQSRGAHRSFMRECEAWRNIRHRNLLKIITSCSRVDFQGNQFKALVYEFMPNGSLHDWLHLDGTSSLNLLQIIKILLDIANALDYIHNNSVPTIVHGDLKPSNILLDDDMVAHVGDFGLARFLGTSYQNNSTGIRGTIGYVAPEYGLGSEMTNSGDVYSFGILILEVMTRKRPTDDIFNEDLCLHKFASMALQDHVTDIIDVNIVNAYQEDIFEFQNKNINVNKVEECLATTIKIGVSCSMDSPIQRMDIKKVVYELQQILDSFESV